MTFTNFIKRPVLSTVISVVIVLLGFIGLATLPIEQYPDIAPPTVVVFTSYPGADAETVKNSVLVPLEESINGVEGMDYISSSASSGSASLSILFRHTEEHIWRRCKKMNVKLLRNYNYTAQYWRVH